MSILCICPRAPGISMLKAEGLSIAKGTRHMYS